MFKKTKKLTPKQEFINFLEKQVIMAQGQEKSYVIFPVEKPDYAVWAKEYAKQRGFTISISHQTEGIVYYNMKGWAV